MKLMFWKKKTNAGEEAAENLAVNAKPRESLDFATAGHNPEPSEHEASGTDEAGPETPAKPGFIARLKLRLGDLAQRFKRAPTFRAEVEPGDAAPMDATPEAPARPDLAVRIKLQFIALVRRFRNPPTSSAAEEISDEAGESSAPEATAKPGLLMRVKAGFAAFAREIKTPTPAADEEEAGYDRATAVPEEEFPEEEEEAVPARPRKWLVVGGSILIVVLLIVDISITLWLAYEPQQKRWGTRHDITSISSRPLDSESALEEPLNEAEALRRKNAELQARIEALKKAQPQQRPYAAPAWQAGEASMPSSAVGGEMTVGGQDPKAAAMTLKEAIEAMNAASGDYPKKPAK